MELFVLGTSQSVASARVRERMHIGVEAAHDALRPLWKRRDLLAEAVPLTTCARLELYGVAPDVDRAVRLIGRLMARRAGVPHRDLDRHMYVHRGRDAARHLLRVAAGLDSIVHGEAQILGQVRDTAHHPAVGSMKGPVLHRLFQDALRTGKRVRRETEIGRGAASLASASLVLLRREIGALQPISALVLGAGDTGALMARLLAKSGVERLVIANRTYERAQTLAAELDAESSTLDRALAMLPEVDLVVGAVTAPEPIITLEHARQDTPRPGANGAVPGARKPRYFLDLGHPRNVEPALGELPGFTVFDLEHVFERVEAARAARAAQVPLAEAIVEEETEAFLHWRRARENSAIVKAVRGHVMERAMSEADLYGRRLPPEYREQVRQIARSVARALLHRPTVALREADPTSENGRVLLAGAAELFGVDERL